MWYVFVWVDAGVSEWSSQFVNQSDLYLGPGTNDSQTDLDTPSI